MSRHPAKTALPADAAKGRGTHSHPSRAQYLVQKCLYGSGLALVFVTGLEGCASEPPPAAPVEAPVSTPAPAPTGNRAPRAISARVQPDNAHTLDDLRVRAEAVDPDGDIVTWQYQWYRNGEKLLGEIGEAFPASKTQHGDKLEVEVIPFDGRVQGAVFKSGSVTIQNSTPRLENEPPPGASLDGFRLSVRDDDDDPITFRLEGQPPGMTIDADGTLRWKNSSAEKPGEYAVSITVADGQGGTVTIKFALNIQQVSRPASAPAAPAPPAPASSPAP